MGGAEAYCPSRILGLGVVSGSKDALPLLNLPGFRSRSFTSLDSSGRPKLIISYFHMSDDSYFSNTGVRTKSCKNRTSNDCAYQSCTFLTDGISLSPSGRWVSSWTRCASRIGSSSARNWEARNSVPGRWE